MKNFIFVFLVSLLISSITAEPLFADAGVLIPRDKQQPDPAILSLEEIEITVRIDNGDARVFVRQIFANHTGGIQEGNYIFALPSHATISDFATWDGPTRIPAVILERPRAIFVLILSCERLKRFATSRRLPRTFLCRSTKIRPISSKATLKDRTSTWAKTSRSPTIWILPRQTRCRF